MSRVDVQVIGWIIVHDVCVEACRLAIGGTPRVAGARRALLGRSWRDMRASVTADQFAAGPQKRRILRRAVSLPENSSLAMRAFLALLITSYPELYAPAALRNRCLCTAARIIACVLCALFVEDCVVTSSARAAIISFCRLVPYCSGATVARLHSDCGWTWGWLDAEALKDNESLSRA